MHGTRLGWGRARGGGAGRGGAHCIKVLSKSGRPNQNWLSVTALSTPRRIFSLSVVLFSSFMARWARCAHSTARKDLANKSSAQRA